jgi:hypothetical protein
MTRPVTMLVKIAGISNMNEKSFELFSKEHAATEKFDYFMCSIAGALFAYIGQTYTPHVFCSWYFFLMPAALISLTISFLFGLWLIYDTRKITKINKECVSLDEENAHIRSLLNERDKLSGLPFKIFHARHGPPNTRDELENIASSNTAKFIEASKNAKQMMNFADKLEWTRNISLGTGFLLVLSSKIIQPYFST